MSLLDLQLDAWYGQSAALTQVGFTLDRGEVLGLVGASGSGKSTLALAVLGLLGHKRGRVAGRLSFEDRDLLPLKEREWRTVRGRRIALVPQNPHGALNPVLRLRTHFEEAWRAHASEPWPEREVKLLDQFATLELPSDAAFLRRYPGEVSTGQAQRVLIALALLHQPKLLIADEPTSALDPLAARETLDLFRRINVAHGVAMLYISHDLASVAGLCHRVAILHGGRLVEIGATAQIFSAPREQYTQRLVAAIPRIPVWTPEPTPLDSLARLGEGVQPPALDSVSERPSAVERP
jgi:ABC-type glutathione transport system ATPase component